MIRKQVNRSHYEFNKYVDKKRWASIWHQLDELISLKPQIVLELGPGTGILKSLAENFGIKVYTIDIDLELRPDCIALTTDLPFYDNTFDCVCAFQMLEHLPYDESIIVFNEMSRITKNHLIISLPDANSGLFIMINPFKWFDRINILQRNIKINIPKFNLPIHHFTGQHYWEINKKGFPLRKVINDFSAKKSKLVTTYRVFENPYHRFFIFKKRRE